MTVLAAWVIGCSGEPTPPTFDTSDLPADDSLRGRIDTMVDHTLHNRTLNTKTHNAWQIVHGILPYGKEFQIEHDGQLVGALDWLLEGGQLNGWELRPGDQGIIAVLAPGSREAQGHPDQWIGYLSQCGLHPDEKLVVQGKEYTVGDLITQAQWDMIPGMEATWTLMALSTYFPPDHQWTAKNGEAWTIERLAEMEAGAPLVGPEAACGGTHRLYALSAALNRYMSEAQKAPSDLKGGWKKVDDVVQEHIRKARAYQQPDGSFSTNFFSRPGSSSEIDTTLHATGHTLEWLAIALDDEQFNQPWVTAAVVRLCELLEDNADRELDCGALYHAARGLILFRQRRWGERETVKPAETASRTKNSGFILDVF